MPTKAELEQTAAEYEAFRQRVVDIGLRYADRHGWCGVVMNALDDIGLGDLLPGQYSIEYKTHYGWQTHCNVDSEEAGHRALNQLVRQRLAQARRDYRLRWRNFSKSATRREAVRRAQEQLDFLNSRSLRITIDADDPPEEVQAARQRARDERDQRRAELRTLLEEAKKIPDDVKEPFVEPTEPQYRLVYKPWRGRQQVLAKA